MTLDTIINAKSPEEVFGSLSDIPTLKKEFKRLSIIAHPDKNNGSRKSEDAFNLLVSWFEKALYKLERGTYGNKDAMTNIITITSKKDTYSVVDLIKAGDLADVYLAFNNNNMPVTVKAIRSHTNNDLGKNELTVLNAIEKECGGLPAWGHIASIKDSFQIRQDGIQKQVNVFTAMDSASGWCTAEQIIKTFPLGIDLRDAAWMFNRLLAALLIAHQSGYVHAAVVPSHLMLHLPTHNGVLLDWCYAVKEDSKAKALTPEIQEVMPAELPKGNPLSFGTDLYMATKLFLKLVGGERNIPAYPPSVRGLFRACLLPQNNRTNDVNELYEDFNNELKGLYGDRKFKAFEMESKGVKYGRN